VCASTEHFAAKCPNCKGNNSANMVISEPGGISCTVIYYLQFFQFFVHPNDGLTLVLIFMFVLMLLYFLLTRSTGLPPC
jgi:hypothetical protein